MLTPVRIVCPPRCALLRPSSIDRLYSIGFALTYSCLILKTWRIDKLFGAVLESSPSAQHAMHVKESTLLLVSMALVLVVAIINGVWLGMAPLTFIRTVTAVDHNNSPLKSTGRCESELSVVFMSIFGALQGGGYIYGTAVLVSGVVVCMGKLATPHAYRIIS